MRVKPEDKPKPPGFPKKDPMAVFMPLFDSYPGPVRAENMENPRMSPVLAPFSQLPENLLVLIAGLDILVHEQLTFLERIKQEKAQEPKYKDRRIESTIFEGQFHGWDGRKLTS